VGLGRSSRDDDTLEFVLLDRRFDITCATFRAVGKVIIGTCDAFNAFRGFDKSFAVNDGSDVDASAADENTYLWTLLIFFFIGL
jgi:hypothetical protein